MLGARRGSGKGSDFGLECARLLNGRCNIAVVHGGGCGSGGCTIVDGWKPNAGGGILTEIEINNLVSE